MSKITVFPMKEKEKKLLEISKSLEELKNILADVTRVRISRKEGSFEPSFL